MTLAATTDTSNHTHRQKDSHKLTVTADALRAKKKKPMTLAATTRAASSGDSASYLMPFSVCERTKEQKCIALRLCFTLETTQTTVSAILCLLF